MAAISVLITGRHNIKEISRFPFPFTFCREFRKIHAAFKVISRISKLEEIVEAFGQSLLEVSDNRSASTELSDRNLVWDRDRSETEGKR